MNLNLHRNARTTPAIRQELRESTKSDRELAREYHLNRATVRKWRRRDTGQDASHRPHRIHATLSPVQEQVVVALRQTLLLPLDDLLAMTREFIHPAVSRSGLDRCLRRHGVSNLSALIPHEGSNRPRPSRTTRQGSSTLMSKTCRRCPTRRRISLCSSRSIAPRAGSTLKSYPRKPPPTPAISCSAWSRKSRSTSRRSSPTTARNSLIASAPRASASRPGAIFSTRVVRVTASNTDSSPPATRRPMAWWNASMGASPTCSPPPASIPPRTSRTPSPATSGSIPSPDPTEALGHVAPIQALKNWQQTVPGTLQKASL